MYDDTNKENRFLFDTGVSENGIIYNADLYGIDFRTIEAIVLSHGHMDHCRGLVSVSKRIFKPTHIIVHPDAFLKRWAVYPNGKKEKMPTLDENALRNNGAILHKIKDVSYLPLIKDGNSFKNNNQLLMISGQIPRETKKEEEYNNNEKNLVPDPLVKDDQAVIANLKDKGHRLWSCRNCKHH